MPDSIFVQTMGMTIIEAMMRAVLSRFIQSTKSNMKDATGVDLIIASIGAKKALATFENAVRMPPIAPISTPIPIPRMMRRKECQMVLKKCAS